MSRLKADLYIRAHLAQCSRRGVPAYVTRKGDERGGTLLVKLVIGREGCKVLRQTSDMDGGVVFEEALGGALTPETDADDYIRRQIGYDEDLWVVEIESPDGWHPFGRDE